MKISIIGYSGSGKSTLASILSKHYQIPALYLDTINFESDWIPKDTLSVQTKLDDFLKSNEEWVIDGNYRKFSKTRLEESNLIFFFNFNRFTCLKNVIKRYFAYKNTPRISRPEGCVENLKLDFISWVLFGGRTRVSRQFYKEAKENYGSSMIEFKNRKQELNYLKEKGIDLN